MNKITIIGIGCWLFSALLLGFQGISSLMGTEGNKWKNLTLVDMFPGGFNWVDTISSQAIYDATVYVVTMPAFIIFIVLGLFFFIINAFVKV
jgi:hypothetical protein